MLKELNQLKDRFSKTLTTEMLEAQHRYSPCLHCSLDNHKWRSKLVLSDSTHHNLRTFVEET
jgi:hypothetical protein